jgi:hypothetical protein
MTYTRCKLASVPGSGRYRLADHLKDAICGLLLDHISELALLESGDCKTVQPERMLHWRENLSALLPAVELLDFTVVAFCHECFHNYSTQ